MKKCRNCGEPIERGSYSDTWKIWFHSNGPIYCDDAKEFKERGSISMRVIETAVAQPPTEGEIVQSILDKYEV
jgi:hypothetical protein